MPCLLTPAENRVLPNCTWQNGGGGSPADTKCIMNIFLHHVSKSGRNVLNVRQEQGAKLARARALGKAPVDTGHGSRLARRRHGKGSRLLTVGREHDGRAGSRLVDWTRRESTVTWRDETRSWNGSVTGRGIGGEHSRKIGLEQSRESVRNIDKRTVGKTVAKSVRNVVRIWPGYTVRNGWEHDREQTWPGDNHYKQEHDTEHHCKR